MAPTYPDRNVVGRNLVPQPTLLGLSGPSVSTGSPVLHPLKPQPQPPGPIVTAYKEPPADAVPIHWRGGHYLWSTGLADWNLSLTWQDTFGYDPDAEIQLTGPVHPGDRLKIWIKFTQNLGGQPPPPADAPRSGTLKAYYDGHESHPLFTVLLSDIALTPTSWQDVSTEVTAADVPGYAGENGWKPKLLLTLTSTEHQPLLQLAYIRVDYAGSDVDTYFDGNTAAAPPVSYSWLDDVANSESVAIDADLPNPNRIADPDFRLVEPTAGYWWAKGAGWSAPVNTSSRTKLIFAANTAPAPIAGPAGTFTGSLVLPPNTKAVLTVRAAVDNDDGLGNTVPPAAAKTMTINLTDDQGAVDAVLVTVPLMAAPSNSQLPTLTGEYSNTSAVPRTVQVTINPQQATLDQHLLVKHGSLSLELVDLPPVEPPPLETAHNFRLTGSTLVSATVAWDPGTDDDFVELVDNGNPAVTVEPPASDYTFTWPPVNPVTDPDGQLHTITLAATDTAGVTHPEQTVTVTIAPTPVPPDTTTSLGRSSVLRDRLAISGPDIAGTVTVPAHVSFVDIALAIPNSGSAELAWTVLRAIVPAYTPELLPHHTIVWRGNEYHPRAGGPMVRTQFGRDHHYTYELEKVIQT